jgi:hypothetical protein
MGDIKRQGTGIEFQKVGQGQHYIGNVPYYSPIISLPPYFLLKPTHSGAGLLKAISDRISGFWVDLCHAMSYNNSAFIEPQRREGTEGGGQER